MKIARTILAALLVLAVLAPTMAEAKKHRGETCWRTNRYTHQHFRIC